MLWLTTRVSARWRPPSFFGAHACGVRRFSSELVLCCVRRPSSELVLFGVRRPSSELVLCSVRLPFAELVLWRSPSKLVLCGGRRLAPRLAQRLRGLGLIALPCSLTPSIWQLLSLLRAPLNEVEPWWCVCFGPSSGLSALPLSLLLRRRGRAGGRCWVACASLYFTSVECSLVAVSLVPQTQALLSFSRSRAVCFFPSSLSPRHCLLLI